MATPAGPGCGEGVWGWGTRGGGSADPHPPQCGDAPQPPVAAVSRAWPPAVSWGGAAGWGLRAPISLSAPPESHRAVETTYAPPLLYRSPPPHTPPPSLTPLPFPSRCSPSPQCPPTPPASSGPPQPGHSFVPRHRPGQRRKGKPSPPAHGREERGLCSPFRAVRSEGQRRTPRGVPGDVGTESGARRPAGLGWDRDGRGSVPVCGVQRGAQCGDEEWGRGLGRQRGDVPWGRTVWGHTVGV